MEDTFGTIRGAGLEAIRAWQMIPDGARVLVGMSGGKDSLALMHVLADLVASGELRCQPEGLHIETDAPCDPGVYERLIKPECDRLGIPCHKVFFPIMEASGPSLSCFYCAMRRRAAMFKFAEEHAFPVLALGHHLDDLGETLLMNMVFHGNISTMSPVQTFFKGKLRLIRPFAAIPETEFKAYRDHTGLPFRPSGCPFSSANIRGTVKRWLGAAEQQYPGSKLRILKALQALGTESSEESN